MVWKLRRDEGGERREYKKPEWAKLYKSNLWKETSELYRDDNRCCVICLSHGVTRASEIVDHIIPHKGDLVLFWDKNNWQALCELCHNAKSARE